MNLFQRLKFAGSLLIKRNAIDTIKSLSSSYGWHLNAYPSESDAIPNPSVLQSEKITTVFNCINVISQDVSVLPFQVKRNGDKGKEIVRGTINRLLHDQPNPFMNAYQFKYCMNFMEKARGNAYAYIMRDGNYQPTALYPLIPGEVTTHYDKETATWFYKIRGVYFSVNDIFHLRTFTLDGFNGLSVLEWNANLLGLKMKTHNYKGASIGNRPNGFLKGEVTDVQAQDIAKSWNDKIDSGETPFLRGGDIDYKTLMFTPEQADLVASEKWTDTMTFGMFRVQPVMLGIHEDSNYSNAEQQNIIHAKYTLSALITAWEQEANSKLFSESNKTSQNPMYAKINYSGLLRGDVDARTKFYTMLRTLGLSDANTILDLEDMEHLEGDLGKKVVIQGAMVDLESLGKEGNGDPSGQRMLTDLKEVLKKYQINGFAHEAN